MPDIFMENYVVTNDRAKYTAPFLLQKYCTLVFSDRTRKLFTMSQQFHFQKFLD